MPYQPIPVDPGNRTVIVQQAMHAIDVIVADLDQRVTQAEGDATAAGQVAQAKYTKPTNGIPTTDLDAATQQAIAKANGAVQSVPVATQSTAGIVKPGSNTQVAQDGTITVTVVDDLTTGGAATPLAADQGVALKVMVDANAQAIQGKQDSLQSNVNIKTVGGVSLVGPGDVALPVAATATPQANAQAGAVGTSIKFAREDHRHAETLTSLTYNPSAKVLTYVAENGVATNLDLSALAIDMTVSGATYNATTGFLTLTESAGGPTVTVDLSSLKAVGTGGSIVGDGAGSTIQLSGDMATPGNLMLYGTNAAGVKGWYSIPVVPTAASATPLQAGTAAVGVSVKYAREDHVHPTDSSRAPAGSGSNGAYQVADVQGLNAALAGKQATLQSGVSIKTVGGASLLGAGDVFVPVVSTATPTHTGQTSVVGTSTNYSREDHQHAETLTSIAYNATTKALTYTAENGVATVLDLSGLAIDMTVTGATYNQTTGVLTLNESNGGPSVTVDLSTLKAVTSGGSITGDGAGATLQLSGDVVAPGNAMLYGTNSSGVKGWYAIPVVPVAASALPTQNGAASVGASAKFAREDHVHPTDTSRAPVGTGIGGAYQVSDVQGLTTALSGKQATLQSGVNLKTVGGSSLLGTGDVFVPVASSAAPVHTGQTAVVGTSPNYAREDHQHAETLTILAYNATTKALTYTAENGVQTVLDLSGLAIDMTVTGAAYNQTTGVLTLSESNGGPTVTVDLSTLKAVTSGGSITGDGASSTLQLLGDVANPGNLMLYGTNAAGAKGWYAIPVIPQAATATPLQAGAGAVGTSAKFAREDHQHPTDTSRAPITPGLVTSSGVIASGGPYTNGGAADFTLTFPVGMGQVILIKGLTNNLIAAAGSGTNITGLSTTNGSNPIVIFTEYSTGTGTSIYRGDGVGANAGLTSISITQTDPQGNITQYVENGVTFNVAYSNGQITSVTAA